MGTLPDRVEFTEWRNVHLELFFLIPKYFALFGLGRQCSPQERRVGISDDVDSSELCCVIDEIALRWVSGF